MNYDNMTDKELIREADGKAGLIHALSERLDMRQQPDSVFHDCALLMRALGEETARDTPKQAEKYRRCLIDRELDMRIAVLKFEEDRTFTALIRIMAACIGYGLSRGWPMEKGWQEHMTVCLTLREPDMARVLREYGEELS